MCCIPTYGARCGEMLDLLAQGGQVRWAREDEAEEERTENGNTSICFL